MLVPLMGGPRGYTPRPYLGIKKRRFVGGRRGCPQNAWGGREKGWETGETRRGKQEQERGGPKGVQVEKCPVHESGGG